MKICELCGKTFTSDYGLKYHTNNKVCQKPSNSCEFCLKEFKSKQSHDYHVKQNVCGNYVPKHKIVLKSSYNNLSKEELIVRLNESETKYKTLKENPQVINNNTNNNNIIVFPDAYGNENIDHIQKKLGDILGQLIKHHPFTSIPTLFVQIHNNNKFPEYHNVYISSERSNYAMVSDGKTFNHKPKKTIIDQIIEDKRSILNQYIDDNGEQLGEKVLSKYDKYQNQIDENSEFRKDLECEIGGLLLDMKSVIANDDKTRQLLDKVNDGQYNFDT
jgi:hypothetical protein